MLNLTTILCTALFGSMLFFVIVLAPVIAHRIEDEAVLTFIRTLFSRYCLWGGGVSVGAALLALVLGSYTSILLTIIVLGFAYSHQILLPKMTAAKADWLASDSAQNKARYHTLHKRGVIISAVQLLVLLLIIVTNQVANWL